jgi:hypothetical protein
MTLPPHALHTTRAARGGILWLNRIAIRIIDYRYVASALRKATKNTSRAIRVLDRRIRRRRTRADDDELWMTR